MRQLTGKVQSIPAEAAKCRQKPSSGWWRQHKNRTMPGRPGNSDLRTREYLTPHEKLIKAARKSGKTDAQGQRNATLVLFAYRHGLRAQELCDLEWSQVDWKAATQHIQRWLRNDLIATMAMRFGANGTRDRHFLLLA
jgi:integrase